MNIFGSKILKNTLLCAKNELFFAITIFVSAIGLFPESSHAEPPGNTNIERWAKGRILVAPRAGLPEAALANILKEHKGKARKIGQSDLYIVEVPASTEARVIEKLKNHPHLKFAELDRQLPAALIPNDPYFNYLGDALYLPKIGAPTAWDITQGAGVTIAILDSGVASAQPDLAPNLVPGWNFYDNNADTSDVYGHGTRVAGTASAVTNNGIGVASVAGQSKVMPLRVTDTGGFGYSTLMAQALIYAADHGARVANLSFLGLTSFPSIQQAAQYMKSKNGLVVTGAGNTGSLESYLATPTMISVSATDNNDVKTSFSSFGDYVTLAAPGDGIWTTYRDGRYWAASGTSIASPVAGGVIALMMSANPSLPSTQIESLLYSTAVDLGTPGRDIYFGYGRVDAANAVQAARDAVPLVDTTAPAASISNPATYGTVSGLVPVDVTATDNVGVSRVELQVNGSTVAIDTSSPFAFSWDSSGVPNGMNNLVAHAFDAAGNSAASSTVAVNVANSVSTPTSDTAPPVVTLVNPVAGNVSGSVTITANASDNSGAAGISLSIYIDGALKASGTGSTLSTSWNTKPKSVKPGSHTVRVDAKDKAGNTSSSSVMVNVVK